MGRYKKPRVLAEFDFRFDRARIVDRTGTVSSRSFTVKMETRQGWDAMNAERWGAVEPRVFKYMQDGQVKELRHYTEQDLHEIVYALCRKLRARRRMKKGGGK